MGREFFSKFPTLVKTASDVLGYSIEELCVSDPENKLTKTEFTQPALYVTGALAFLDRRESLGACDFAAGHSLGEYNALFAAEVFSFEEGLELVQLRGNLMAEAAGGGMAAVLGLPPDEVARALRDAGLFDAEVANLNTPTQSVISGAKDEILRAERVFQRAGIRFVPLNVGAAFHSRYMKSAQEVFNARLSKVTFRRPRFTVIANATGRPYETAGIAQTLGQQIASPVRWMDSVVYLLAQGPVHCIELGSTILTKMVDEIRKACAAEITALAATQRPAAPVSSPRYFAPW